jgi:catechol 2,3-dioxygenase-like lactoylglutathione lyase family enzyme
MLTRIDHVMICVPDLAKGIETYTRLGFTVTPAARTPAGRPTTRSRSTTPTTSRS